jgi:hypothetical protein
MKIRRMLGFVLLIAEVIWTVGFPKSKFQSNLMRPDLVASVAMSIGLFGSGGLLLASRVKSLPTLVLSITLLWSCLANVTLYAIARDYVRHIQETDEIYVQHHR